MGFTATIMSEDEAMALPLKDRPICFRLSSEMYHAVFESIGAASMCWEPKPSNETFDPSTAEKLAVELLFKVAEEKESANPNPREIQWLKGRIKQLEERCATLESRAHDPVDLLPVIKKEVADAILNQP